MFWGTALRTIRNVALFVIVVALPAGLAMAGSERGGAAAKQYLPSQMTTPATGTSLSKAERGKTFLCGTNPAVVMTNSNAPWVNGTKIDVSKIPHVEGSVSWKSKFEVATTSKTRRFTGNGLPNTKTGEFPVKKGTAAYKYYAALPAQGYDTAAEIPIKPWDLDISIPREPKVKSKPSCIAKLTLGLANTGAPWHVEIAPDSEFHILNPTAGLPMDKCWGHPYATQYHYHGESWTCFTSRDESGEHSPLEGYAIDGFGIYGIRGEDGKPVKNKELDECHGHTHKIRWEGETQKMYHYHLNGEYPYSLGCFRGTPAPLPPEAS